MGSADTHKKIIDLFNEGDFEGMREYLADNVARIDAPTGATASGADDVLEMIRMWPKSFSDARVSDAEYLEGNSFSVALFNGEGTNDGEFGPFPATGKTISVPFCEVAEFNVDGKLTRTRLYYDVATMLQQLGHMPGPDAS
jgi:steroid delta-isomerase-like uncharacterized protein